MIPWATINPVLVKLCADLSGLQVNWQDQRREYVDNKQQAQILLLVQSEEGIGIDDRRTVCKAVPIPQPNITFSQNGHRRVNVDIRVESFRHDDDRFAFNAISKIRTGLGFLSSLARLRTLNIAVIRKSAAINVPNVVNDQRITSAAVLDLELNVGICFEDVDNPCSSIETVQTTRIMKRPDGSIITLS